MRHIVIERGTSPSYPSPAFINQATFYATRKPSDKSQRLLVEVVNQNQSKFNFGCSSERIETMQRAKEAASNVAASAKSGMEKTKATMEEKAEKMTTRDPARKEMAAEKRDERYQEAELGKQEAYDQNAAAKQTHGLGQGYTTGGGGPTGREGYPAGGTGAFVGTQYPSGADTGSRATAGTTTGAHGRRRGTYDEPDIVTPNVGYDAGPTF